MAIFSIAAFVVTLRETMEAALIIGILLAYLTQTNHQKLKRDIWIGTGLAGIASLIGAIIINFTIGEFEGRAEMIFEGVVMVSAALVLTWMILWMRKNAHTLKRDLEEKTESAISENKRFALVGIAFIAVFREGIETVLFLGGISSSESVAASSVGAIAGILVAVVLAVLFFHGTVNLNMKQFFNVTSVILIFFAAGIFSRGIHEFQELGFFGSESNYWNEHLWSTHAILSSSSGFGSILSALFGYTDHPSLIELAAYFVYWAVIIVWSMKISHIYESKMNALTA